MVISIQNNVKGSEYFPTVYSTNSTNFSYT